MKKTVKNVLIIGGVMVLALGFIVARFVRWYWFDEGVSGESTYMEGSLVVAEYGYSHGGRKLLYAVVRSFPTNSTSEQRNNDPRYRSINDDVSVRDNDGHMIPVGRDGTVYIFNGDKLRTMKVQVAEDDIGIVTCFDMDDVWARFQKFEVNTNR
jgi:hypothetical protein